MRARVPAALLVGTTGCLYLPEIARELLPHAARTVVAAVGIFLLPGAILARALRIAHRLDVWERPALWFVLSLAATVASTAVVLPMGGSLASARVVLLFLLALAALVASFGGNGPGAAQSATDARGPSVPVALTILAFLTAAVATGLAWEFTATGSTDRWWYLAYVRGYADAQALSFAEPLLGTGKVHPRFEWNAWLLALALWSKLAGADALWLYDRASPLLLVPLAFSAAYLLGRRLFDDARLATLAALASGWLWISGAILPVVSRTPEDKVLAAVLVAPAAMGLLIDLLRSPGVGATLAAMIATGVLSVTHPLAAGLNAFVLTPFLLLTAWVRERPLLPAGIALAVVAAGLVYPIRTGGEARELLRAQGATLAEPNHPVVRVHLDRDRMMDLGPPGPSGDGRYVVAPRLLAHPLLVAGILSLAFAYRRPREERRFLLLATLLPLAFAFLPRLAMTLGSLVLPWMVYRVLWAVPFALLLATALGFAWSRSPRQGWIAVALLVALSIPGAIASAVGRAAPERAARNTPDPATLGPVLTALANLPGTTVVAAPPLLAERIPALTGKSVLALSDRATFVFAGTRDLAEERLRSRAAIYAGLWKPALEVPVPTHLLFAPGSPAERYCESVIASTSSVSLCTFDRVPPRPGIRMPRAAAPVAGVAEGLREMLGEEAAVLRASCTPAPQVSTNAFVWRPRGPWDPTAAAAVCTFSTRESQSVRLAGLLVRTAAGTPPGEIAISVRALRADAQRWNIRTRERAGADEALWFTLPKSELDTVEITIAGSFLPHLTLADLRVVRIAGAHAGGPP